MDEKTGNIIETLEGIKDKIDKNKKRRTSRGTGQCLVCNILIDDPDAFTCGHPQCNLILREELSAREDLLRELGVSSIKEAAAEIQHIRTIADEIKSKL